ncbi:phosphinothricin acetyltransferase [Azospirillum fermentarium]|uniref:GNAT family N-acetyltransferase n=1 Tax=Azospirillum fermentarium TaxID=1233114 RepID=UPI003872D9AA|nr:phosphinothricin acetyltransferase [Azospirillum fermentarium]
MTASPAVRVRPSHDGDVAAITAIYAHHVLNGTASFEEVAPDAAEIARRRAGMLAQGFPYLVAEIGGEVVGYAYAGLYRTRSAYRFTAEDSIYIHPDRARQGIGRALLPELLDRCTALGYRQMVAVIGGTDNLGSIGLHAAFGFTHAGRLPAVGFKFGRWIDSVLMQRPLGDGDGTPAA